MLKRGPAFALLGLVASFAALLICSDGLAGPATRRIVENAKASLAALGTLLLGVDLWLDRRGRGHWFRRTRDAALALLAVAAAAGWWNFMQFHYQHHLHVSDSFHYYVGSKYFDELGYTRLYACAVVADAEAAGGTDRGAIAAERLVRDLETNRLGPAAAVLADPSGCKRHFTPERWRSFSDDVGWFRARVAPARWAAIQRDHGYNPPPSWTLLGGSVANLGPAKDAQLLLLSLLDPVLIACMWGAVAWAFGWRVLCVAVIFWGTNLFGLFGWTGGSFLRQTWLAASVTGICLLRRDRPFAAGALLGLAAMLRIFPGAILAALALRALIDMARRRRFTPGSRDLRLGFGALAVVVALGFASLLAVGGVSTWSEFVENSRTHLATPLKNHVGWKTVLAHDSEQADRLVKGGSAVERYERWAEARRLGAQETVILRVGGIALFVLLLGLAIRDQPDWVAAILGIGLIPVAFELTNYYYAILLCYGLLYDRWPSVGPMLLAVGAATWVIAGRLQWSDEIMVASSVAVLLLVLHCTLQPFAAAAAPRGATRD